MYAEKDVCLFGLPHACDYISWLHRKARFQTSFLHKPYRTNSLRVRHHECSCIPTESLPFGCTEEPTVICLFWYGGRSHACQTEKHPCFECCGLFPHGSRNWLRSSQWPNSDTHRNHSLLRVSSKGRWVLRPCTSLSQFPCPECREGLNLCTPPLCTISEMCGTPLRSCWSYWGTRRSCAKTPAWNPRLPLSIRQRSLSCPDDTPDCGSDDCRSEPFCHSRPLPFAHSQSEERFPQFSNFFEPFAFAFLP